MSNEASGETNGSTPPAVLPVVLRRDYDSAFKKSAIARIKQGEKVSQVAGELRIGPSLLRRWVRGLGVGVTKPTKVAGVRVLPSGRKYYSESFRRAAVRRFNKGKEIASAICDDLGIHNSMLARWREQLSPASVASPVVAKRSHRFSDEEKAVALARVEAGETAKDVGKSIGMTPSGLYYWRKTGKGSALPVTPPPKPNALGVAFGRGAGINALPLPVKDAITLLRHAKTEAYLQLSNGTIKEFAQRDHYMQMALNELEKLL